MMLCAATLGMANERREWRGGGYSMCRLYRIGVVSEDRRLWGAALAKGRKWVGSPRDGQGKGLWGGNRTVQRTESG